MDAASAPPSWVAAAAARAERAPRVDLPRPAADSAPPAAGAAAWSASAAGSAVAVLRRRVVLRGASVVVSGLVEVAAVPPVVAPSPWSGLVAALVVSSAPAPRVRVRRVARAGASAAAGVSAGAASGVSVGPAAAGSAAFVARRRVRVALAGAGSAAPSTCAVTAWSGSAAAAARVVRRLRTGCSATESVAGAAPAGEVPTGVSPPAPVSMSCIWGKSPLRPRAHEAAVTDSCDRAEAQSGGQPSPATEAWRYLRPARNRP